MNKTLILYYSREGSTRRMANQIARGVAAVSGCEALIRTVPDLATRDSTEHLQPTSSTNLPSTEPLYVSKEELATADALIVGSPTRFGNMAAPLKHFFDSTSDLWLSGALCNKPAAVFTSSSSLHGGQESTLFTMMLPLLHHGMIMVGIPYTEPALEQTRSGGTPYGASHVSGHASNQASNHGSGHGAGPAMSAEEKTLCLSLGKRVATISLKLAPADQ